MTDELSKLLHIGLLIDNFPVCSNQRAKMVLLIEMHGYAQWGFEPRLRSETVQSQVRLWTTIQINVPVFWRNRTQTGFL